ncbi:MAG: sucrase ferredoxin [Chloroflexi bacterium]|nr:sucrase ferredoxin [Chloroflexota bacterium]
MTLSAPIRCSALADELGEPMIGSVEQRVRWLLVEDHSAWGRDAVKAVLGAELAAAAKARHVGLLLIRRREADPAADAVRRAILVDSESGRHASRVLGNLDDLSASDLDAPIERFGEVSTEPIFLVCTNGKRDACCALRGRPLMSALASAHPNRTWECTHIGGHRFAGNLVCLPAGIVYGRVTPADGTRLADAYLDGRVDADLLRGRSPWPAPAQVAERLVRSGSRMAGLADLRLVSVDEGDGTARVVLEGTDGAQHEVELLAERRSPERAVSCAGDKLEEPMHWVPAGSAATG